MTPIISSVCLHRTFPHQSFFGSILSDDARPVVFSTLAFNQPIQWRGQNYAFDAAAIRTELYDQVRAAAATAGFILHDDWSNFWQRSEVVNALFDVPAIYKGMKDRDELKATCTACFDHILSDAAEEWSFKEACLEQPKYPPTARFTRSHKEVYEFTGKDLGWPAHAVAQPYEGNLLHFLRTTAYVADEDAKYTQGRLSCVVTISGGAKSVLLKFFHDDWLSDEVTLALSTARSNDLVRMRLRDRGTTQGSNLEGLFDDAVKWNEPIGLRSFQEELGDTSRFG